MNNMNNKTTAELYLKIEAPDGSVTYTPLSAALDVIDAEMMDELVEGPAKKRRKKPSADMCILIGDSASHEEPIGLIPWSECYGW